MKDSVETIIIRQPQQLYDLDAHIKSYIEKFEASIGLFKTEIIVILSKNRELPSQRNYGEIEDFTLDGKWQTDPVFRGSKTFKVLLDEYRALGFVAVTSGKVAIYGYKTHGNANKRAWTLEYELYRSDPVSAKEAYGLVSDIIEGLEL
jgi:hypothetical protein